MRKLSYVLLALTTTRVLAQSPAPAPCKQNAESRKFDFWIGSWRVTDTSGTQQVGTSRVDLVSGGCGLLENWRDMRGSEGKSLSTFDPSTHQWRQFWVGQGGLVTDFKESEWHGTSVSFIVHYGPSSPRGAFTSKLTFTPLGPDLVRQHQEISTDEGKTWTMGFDFRYHRVTGDSSGKR